MLVLNVPAIDQRERIPQDAIDRARFIIGQVFVDFARTKEGTPIFIHQGGVSWTVPPSGEGGQQVRQIISLSF